MDIIRNSFRTVAEDVGLTHENAPTHPSFITPEQLENLRNKGLTFCGKKLSIGIINEQTVLKNWYREIGFVEAGTKRFEHLPFTVGFMEIALPAKP